MADRDYAIGVTGFGRCGTTMAMTMLEAAGIPPTATATRIALENDLQLLEPDDCIGRTVKLLDLGNTVPDLLDAIPWRFVWLDRNPIQQGKSMRKFLRTFYPSRRWRSDVAKRFADSFVADRDTYRGIYAARGPVLDLRYEDVLAKPATAAALLMHHLDGGPFDVDAAAAAVHDRTPKCRPDLAFETTGALS